MSILYKTQLLVATENVKTKAILLQGASTLHNLGASTKTRARMIDTRDDTTPKAERGRKDNMETTQQYAATLILSAFLLSPRTKRMKGEIMMRHA